MNYKEDFALDGEEDLGQILPVKLPVQIVVLPNCHLEGRWNAMAVRTVVYFGVSLAIYKIVDDNSKTPIAISGAYIVVVVVIVAVFVVVDVVVIIFVIVIGIIIVFFAVVSSFFKKEYFQCLLRFFLSKDFHFPPFHVLSVTVHRR